MVSAQCIRIFRRRCCGPRRTAMGILIMDTSTTRDLAATEDSAGLVRELGPAERWYWIIDQLSTLNVSARVRVDGELSTEVLRNGLDALRARHPYLRMAIADEASGPRFVSTDNQIPLREVRSDEVDDARWA